MRLAAACLPLLLLAVACGGKEETPVATVKTEAIEATVSDELPGLPAAATGIAFWRHPALSFNSTMVVATGAGIISYNMEDGNEVSRIDGFNATGVAVSYHGFGAQAAGFIAFLDTAESTFRFYGVDNNTRAFLPLDAGPVVRGAVRGYCMGRGISVSAPSLYVIQNSKVQVFNLTASDAGVAVDSEATIATPDNLVSCAIDLDGRLIVAADDGRIYRLSGEDAFSAPFAQAALSAVGDLVIIPASSTEDAADVSAVIVLSDRADGTLHVFDQADGTALGSVKFVATDDLPGVDGADTFGATGDNLGGLYRNGVMAFGVNGAEGGPSIRIAPTSSLKNALSLPIGEPVSPRGEAREPEDDGLIIPIHIDQN